MRVLFSGATVDGASPSASSAVSVSAGLLFGFSHWRLPHHPASPQAWRRRVWRRSWRGCPSCRSFFLSDLSVTTSRNATRSLSPSMTTICPAFSVVRMPLAAANPIGLPALGRYLMRPETVLVLADNAHVRLFGIGILKTIGEPVRHGVAQHQQVVPPHDVRVALLSVPEPWKNSSIFLFRRRRPNGANRSPPNQPPPQARAPPAGMVRPKLKKLRRRRSDDANQQPRPQPPARSAGRFQ